MKLKNRNLKYTIFSTTFYSKLPVKPMKNLKPIIMAIILLLLCSSQSFSTNRLSWPWIKTDLPFDQSVKTGKLENGFRYIIRKNNTPEKRVAVYLGVMAGSMDEEEEERGIAHFLEHIVFCGSKNFEPGEVIKFFQNTGMSFGPDTNAHTGYDETVYKIYLPGGSDGEIKKAFLILSDFVSKASILQSEVDRERHVILAEKRDRDSIEYRKMVKKYQFLFNGMKFPKRMPIGLEEIINKADSNLLRGFYQKNYTANKMVLAVVGDVDPVNIENKLKPFFSGIAKSGIKTESSDDFKFMEKKGIDVFYHHEKESPLTSVSLELIKNQPFESDSISYQSKWLKKYMAMMIISNRLKVMVENGDVPFERGHAFAAHFMKKALWSGIEAFTPPEEYEKSLGIIIGEMKKAVEFGFMEKEVKRVKNDLVSMLEKESELSSTRDSKELASAFISMAMNSSIIVSPEDEKKIYTPIVKKVTKSDLEKSLNEIWDLKNFSVLVTGNIDLGENPQKKIKSIVDKKLGEKVVKDKNNKEIKFPYIFPVKTGSKSVETREYKETGIKTLMLGNNICLNLKKTEFKKDSVLLKLSIGKGSSFDENEKTGIAWILKNVMNFSGTSKLSPDDLRFLTSDTSVFTSFGVDEESFFINGSSSKKDLPFLFNLVFHKLNDPGIKKEALDLVKKRIKSNDLRISKSVDGVIENEFPYFFSSYDKRLKKPDYKDASKISIDDLKNYASKKFDNGEIEISIVGDFDEKEVLDLFIKYFSGVKLRKKNKKSIPEKIVFPEGKDELKMVETKIPGCFILAGVKTDDISKIEKFRILNLGSRVVAERLRERIRVKLGAAYSPFAFNDASRIYHGYGGLYMGVKTTPDKADIVKAEIINLVKNFSVTEITEDEFQRAKKPLINTIKTGIQKNEYWLESVLSGSVSNPHQLKWAESLVSGYSSITLDMVRKEMKKVLKPEKISFFISMSRKAEIK